MLEGTDIHNEALDGLWRVKDAYREAKKKHKKKYQAL